MGTIATRIAPKLHFYPPTPPSYTVHYDEHAKKLVSPELCDLDGAGSVEVLKLPTSRGEKILAVYWRCPEATVTILFSHGNATDLGGMLYFYRRLIRQFRVNLMGYDYSGYGRSTGKPSVHNTYADIRAAYKCLRERYGVQEEDIVLYGHSIGSGPTIDLASRRPNLGGVIIHSGFLSCLRALHLANEKFLLDSYKNIDKISLVKCPVAVIHGTRDNVFDFSHGKQLWELCKEKYDPLWISGGSHNFLETRPEFISYLETFLKSFKRSLVGKEGQPEKTGSEAITITHQEQFIH